MLATPDIIDIKPNRTPELAISPACFTSCPDPCNVCHQHQCTYNLNHGLVFSIAASLEKSLEPLVSSLNDVMEESHAALKESLAKMWKTDPPDDASG